MLKIVLADDNPLAIKGIEKAIDFSSLGATISGCAKNGKQAFDLIKKHDADLVISDISMPIMNGLELSEKLAQEMPQVTIVLISSYDHFEYAQKAIEFNVRHYILKPINKEKLEKLENIIREAALKNEMLKEEDNGLFFNPNKSTKKQKIFNDTIEMIENGFSDADLSLTSIANALGFSRNYIRNIFNEFTNKNINNYITEIRIKKSKELLTDPLANVKDVAERMGFNDPRYFSKVFKKETGVTAKEYQSYMCSQKKP